MREFFRTKYFKWGMVLFAPLAGVALLVLFLLKAGGIFSALGSVVNALAPFIYGGVIAYILRPIYNTCRIAFEKLLHRAGMKSYGKIILISRIFSVILSMALLIAVVVALFIMVIPQLVSSIYELFANVPSYSDHFMSMVNDSGFIKDEWKQLINENWDMIMDRIYQWRDDTLMPYLSELLVKVSTGLVGMVRTAINLFIGLIVCIYILLSKSTFTAQSKKLLYSLFSRENANTVLDGFRFVDRVFSGFVSGNVIDSAVVGLVTFVVMTVMHWPYALLISALVGVTNLIPFFGPFIGAIPSAVLIFSENPIQALYFLVFIIVLQQVDGNILKPRIYGQAVDLPSFWTLFAILVGGSLFGVAGLLLGVPVFTVIYTFVTWLINQRLHKKDMPSDTEKYFRLDRYDEETGEMTYLSEDFIRERKLERKQEKRLRKAEKKNRSQYPMKASELLHDVRPIDDVLREKGLADEDIDRVEARLDEILKELEERDDLY